jgi:Ca2+-binding EF-hand superfamily protein
MGVAPLAPGVVRPSAEQAIVLIHTYFTDRGSAMHDGFRMLDKNGDGYVSWDEFYWGLKLCSQDTWLADVSDDELRSLYQRFDANGDGAISVQEFCGHYALFGGIDMQMAPAPAPPLPPTATVGRIESVDTAAGVITRIAGAVLRMGSSPHDLFNKVDLDTNGNLDVAEVERVCRSFQPDLTANEFAWIWSKFDVDGNGTVSVYEFCKALDDSHIGQTSVSIDSKIELVGHKLKQMGYTIHQAFALFDRNNDGYLERDEWSRVLEFLASQLSQDDKEAMFRRFDLNADGLLSIEEFNGFFLAAVSQSRSQPGTPTAKPAYAPTSPLTGLTAYPALAIASYPALRTPTASQEISGAGFPYIAEAIAGTSLEPWAFEVFGRVRSCLSFARSNVMLDDAFRRLDQTGSGTMTRFEFERMVSAYEPQLAQAHLEHLFSIVNTSGSGEISFDEFRQWFG